MEHDLQALFREVADLSPSEREHYFDDRQVPRELRVEVESLLRFDENTAEILTDCIGATAADYVGCDPALREGGRCGPFELVRLLGRGGMGDVFLAQRTDGEVEQRVAVKLVRNSAEYPAFRERFLRERQILASLSHPGIARLLDAGRTPAGQPYLVMEYIDGAPIDVYARDLAWREKLRLFLQVCDAVSYAHRNLIIHRDLKPSNILVEAGGQPKLLDFGIARMLDEAPDRGLTREQLLTPDYASPEQVRGAARSTATDVYSLGAVLYQLVTGRSPHTQTGGPPEAIEVLICSAEAPPPSRVNPALPRDLDFILAKALRKEPEERYAAVDGLADDLRMLLESRPVRARSGSTWYRSRKFLRRHWPLVSGTAAAMVCLAIGMYVANRERAIAQHRFQQLRQLANKLLRFDDVIRDLPGSTQARQQIVAASMEYLEGLSREARNDRELAMELAGGYLQMGRVQGVPAFPNLGQFAAAEKSLAKADGFLEGVLAADPGRPDALLLAAETEEERMILADTEHRRADARTHARRCVEHLDALIRGGRASPDQVKNAARLYLNVGLANLNLHQFADAIRYARRGVEMARSAGSSERMVAFGLSLLANALRQAGDLAGAIQTITEARSIAERITFRSDTLRASDLYSILMRQGMILGRADTLSLNRPEEAIEPLQRAFDLVEQEASSDPKDATVRERVGSAARELGCILLTRDPQRALGIYDRALVREREVGNNITARRGEAVLLAGSSYALRRLGRPREAKERIDAALDLLRGTKDYPAAQMIPGDEADTVVRALADHFAETGQPQEALATYQDLLARLMASKPDPENDLIQAAGLSTIYVALARLCDKTGKSEDAEAILARRADLWRHWNQKLPGNPFVERQLSVELR